MKNKLNIQAVAHQTILIQWAEEDISTIRATLNYLRKKHQNKILELVPTYRELAIYLHEAVSLTDFLVKLEKELPLPSKTATTSSTLIYEIPVCYDLEKGLDLKEMASTKKLSTDKIIELHSQATYNIHFIGFLPGFPYLSGLDERLHHPRLKSPRIKIPKGSVGIAGNQTGIYPSASPGGWNIIGQTPINLFSVQQQPPAALQAGNKLRFKSIDSKEFQRISEAVKTDSYQISTYND